MPTYTFKEDISPMEKYKVTMYLLMSVSFLKRGLIIAIVPFVIVVAISLYLGQLDSSIGLALIYPAILVFVLMGLPLILVYFFPGKKNMSITVSNAGISRGNGEINFNHAWTYFNSWSENKEFIFIYFKHAKMSAHIIKKSWFKSEEEMMEFLLFVDSSLS